MAEEIGIKSSGLVQNSADVELVKEILDQIQELVGLGRPSICQRQNATVVVRRLKLLSPLFEEVRDNKVPLPPSAVAAFKEVNGSIQKAKFFFRKCREWSVIWMVVDTEAISEKFYELGMELVHSLSTIPVNLMDISIELKEQVELVKLQAKRAKPFVDPAELKLRKEINTLLEELERKETIEASRLENIFKILQLKSSRDCWKEQRRLEEETANQKANGEEEKVKKIKGLISFLQYSKFVVYGVAPLDVNDIWSPRGRKSLGLSSDFGDESSKRVSSAELGNGQAMNPPDEFKCPITLELMRDPVIISTGQTYDRASIEKWMESGNATCPKTGQKLTNKALTPNYALRSLIGQWCERRKIPFGLKFRDSGGKYEDEVGSSQAALEATKLTASFLVGKLATGTPEIQTQAAYELRLLAKCGMENRMCIAQAGAIPFLVPLLSSYDSKTQENAVTALLNLSIYDNNKKLIMEAGALEGILQILTSGLSVEARENAAATIFSLSVLEQNKPIIGAREEIFPALLSLLRIASLRGQKDAISALFNLAVCEENKSRAVAAGAVAVLLELVNEEEGEMVEDALAAMVLLCGCPEGVIALGDPSAIASFVNQLKTGSMKAKENSVGILLILGKSSNEKVADAIFKDVSIKATIYPLLSSGSQRCKRKAAAFLKHMHRWEDPSKTTTSFLVTR